MSTIRCRLMTEDDEDRVRQLCYHFFKSEPVALAVGLEIPRECEQCVEQMLQVARSDKVSVVAEDVANGSIVGVSIFSLLTRGETQQMSFPEDDPNCQKMIKIEQIYGQINLGGDYCTVFNVDRVMYGVATAVLPEYQRKGVGLQMIQYGRDICKSLHIQLAITDCTNDYSRKIAGNLGFQTVKQVNLVDNETGEPLKMPGDSKGLVGSLHILYLSQKGQNGNTVSKL